MKHIFIGSIVVIMMMSCNENNAKLKIVQDEINYLHKENDSLKMLIQKVKPGLGEIMLGVQIHHDKLWFAGKEENWKLAQFEQDEIMELLNQAESIENERSEVKLFRAMIYPQLDTLYKAIAGKDEDKFYRSFVNVTSACNSCHAAVHYEYNMIKIPESPPFSNQKFSSNE